MVLVNSPEKELALLLATGQGANPQVVKALMDGYGAEIEQLIRALLDPGDLPGGSAETFVPAIISQAIIDAHNIERKDNVQVWLYSVAIRFWQEKLAKKNRASPLSKWFLAFKSERPALSSASYKEFTKKDLDLYFERLPEKLRPTFLLWYAKNLPITQISQILDLSEREIRQHLELVRRPFLHPPEASRRHPRPAARQLQTEIMAAFDLSPGQTSRPDLEAHLQSCEECKQFREELIDLELRIREGLDGRWKVRPLSEATILKLSTQSLTLLEQRDTYADRKWPLKELAGILVLGAAILLIFRFLTPAVVDYTPTPTPAMLPTINRRETGTPALIEQTAATYRLSKTLIGEGATIVNRIVYSQDGELLVSGSEDTLVRVWGGPDESNLVVLRGHTSEVTSLGFSPDSTYLASGDAQGYIHIWNPFERYSYSTLDNSPGPIIALEFSPDGNLLAVGTQASMWLWVVNRQAFVRVFEYPGSDINSLSFSPFGDTLAVADANTVYLRRVRDGQLLLKYENHTAPVTRVIFSPNGNWLASGAQDQSVIVAQINPVSDGSYEAEIVYSLEVASEITDIAFSRDSTLLAVATQKGDIALFFSPDGHLVQEIPGGGRYATFSPRSSTLATIGTDGQIRLWEPESEQ